MRTRAALAIASLLALLTIAIGFVLVSSIDGAPPDDAHLILEEDPIPREQDGFEILLQAIESTEWPEGPAEEAWLEEHLSDEPAADRRAGELLERNRKALTRLDHAIDAPHFRARMRLAEESGPTTPFRRLLQLGNLVALRSEYQLFDGDEDGAFRGLLRYLELGRRFQRSGEMIDYLIGGAHEVRAIDQILRLSSFPAAGNLDEVARRLGEHAWEPEAMENTLKREYGVVTAGLEEVLGESANWRDAVILRYTHQPHRTRQLFAKSYSAAIHELREDCSAAPRAQEPSKWWYLGPNFGGRGLHAISTGPLPKFISARCGDQMRNGLTRLALALRAYRVDKGRLPENLDALVPEYVPAIPRDLDGQSFRYSARREILYSVGDDRLDGGGGEPTFRVDWSGPDPGVTLSHR